MAKRLVIVPPHRRTTNATRSVKNSIVRQPKIALSTARMHERKAFPWRPIFRILFFASLVAGAVWIFYSPIFVVRTVAVEGLEIIPQNVVVATIPKTANLWLFPISEVKNKIKQSSPYVADVVLYRGIPNAIRIIVAERVLVADWESSNKHYLIGLDGTVIAAADPPKPLLKIVDTTGIFPIVGKPVASPGFIHFVTTLEGSFEKIVGVPIQQLEIGETTFDVTIVPQSGPRVIVESTRNAEVQLKSARAVLDEFGEKITEYIDVRVAGKGYYK